MWKIGKTIGNMVPLQLDTNRAKRTRSSGEEAAESDDILSTLSSDVESLPPASGISADDVAEDCGEADEQEDTELQVGSMQGVKSCGSEGKLPSIWNSNATETKRNRG